MDQITNSQSPKPKDGIVLNRMYAGGYLSSNLGHEVINMYRADNDNFYLYLNSDGNFAECHKKKISSMLLVKYHSTGVVEVVGAATGLTDLFDPNNKESIGKNEIFNYQKDIVEGIRYGQQSLLAIFDGAEYQNVFVTYQAEVIWKRKSDKPLYVVFEQIDTTNLKGEIVNIIDKGQAKTSLKQYIYRDSVSYEELMQKIFNTLPNHKTVSENMNWELASKITEQELGKSQIHQTSLFDICQIQNNENIFSNALQYFMEKYPAIWKEFFKQHGVKLGVCYKVSREVDVKIENTTNNNNEDYTEQKSTRNKNSGRIDLLIRDDKNIIVIENKIKSDINSIESDRRKEEQQIKDAKDTNGQDGLSKITQLNRYKEYVDWLIRSAKTKNEENTTKEELEPHYFILAPNYNIPSDTMDDLYKVITYGDLYNFLKITSAVKEDPNFKAFFEAMHRHTHENVNDYLYYEMQEKFFNRIKQFNK